MLRVRTESGSVYDVDHAGMRIRRVHGRHGPADTQPQDGIWRRFNGLDGPVAGQVMVVYWATEAAGARETTLGFRTTVVTEVAEVATEPAPEPAPTTQPEAEAGAGTASQGPGPH